MGCFHPLEAFRGRSNPATGKQSIVFDKREAISLVPIQLPCGQCIGCRLEHSRQWAIRCVHEAQLHEENCFITLTFNDEHLPADGSLNVRHWQLFAKRFRKMISPRKFRFFHCGEYGDYKGRPHYHACIFGYNFRDRYIWQVRNKVPLYRSPTLEKLWTDPETGESLGYCSVGDVTFESAAYVARYVLKKRTGKNAWIYYNTIDYVTGEVVQELKPEYTTMSRRPGLAAGWFKKYKSDVYPGDFVVLRGKKMRPPKFYDGLFELSDPDEYGLVKSERKLNAKRHEVNNTPERLDVREKVLQSRIRLLPRNHDEG